MQVWEVAKVIKQDLVKTLAHGDTIEVWGTYSSNCTSRFSLNILDENDGFLLHVDFRPSDNVVAINSKLDRSTQSWNMSTGIRCAFPAFVDGEEFKITVECGEDHYIIYFNDVPLEKTFPYREAISTGKKIFTQKMIGMHLHGNKPKQPCVHV